MATYRIETDQGSYDIETDEPSQGAQPAATASQPGPIRAAAGAAMDQLGRMISGPADNIVSSAPDKFSPGKFAEAAMSPIPGSLAALTGQAMQEPSRLIQEKLKAEGHPTLGFLAGMATDPATYAGAEAGGAAAKTAIQGGAEAVAGATESAFPKLAGKMMEIFKKPSTMLPPGLGGPPTMAEAKQGLDEAEKLVMQKLKATSLEEIDKSAKVLERSRSGLQPDVIDTVDKIRQNQVLAQNPNLAGQVKPSPVPVEDLIQAEKALKARISKLFDNGLGDHAKAMQMELDRVSRLVDQALPQLKDARQAYHLSALRDEVTSGGIMNTPLAGLTLKRMFSTPGLVSYGMAGAGAAIPAVGAAGRAAGAGTNVALERLTRKYLPRKE